jgi:hypothetical protein
MFTKRFWKATAERVVRGAAIAAATVTGLDGSGVIHINVDPQAVGAAAIYGAVGSLILSLIGGTLGSGDGPSVFGQEHLEKPVKG